MHKGMPGKDWNEGHPDHEGEMAVSQLHRMSEMADMLLDIIGENDDLPGWVQYKLTRAYSDLNDVFGYIEAKSHRDSAEAEPMMQQMQPPVSLEKEVSEGKKKKKGLWHNVNKRKKAGLPARKPGDPNYPDQKSWDAASKKESLVRTLRRLVQEEIGKR